MNLKDDLKTIDSFTVELNPLSLHIANVIGLETPAAREFLRYSLANVLLMDRKQKDYGPHNIGQGGTYGCVTRMQDKLSRLLNLFNGGRRRRAINESITDSFRDGSNYNIIALMLENGRWPGYEKK